ncbi:tetratricopeptide repeat protein [Actinomyces viscosus]|nr:tetratricopeptide repeat protein [Actinomyces viscosus]
MPSPTTPSGQSWINWFSPLDDLWKNHPFVAFIASLIMTAAVIPLAIRFGKRTWEKWKRRQRAQRITARKQQLPAVRPPFTVELGNQRLTLEPAQPRREHTAEGMNIVRLLTAKSTPVPFLDRAEVLTRLETWARSEERFAIHVLGGDGGSGKTRLGVELCRSLAAAGTPHQNADTWKAGFLEEVKQLDDATSSEDMSSLLFVVDYAEGRPDIVKEAITSALHAAEDPERQRVRLVFLVRRPSPLPTTRQGSNEWVDTLRPQDSHNEGLDRLLDVASTIVLNNEELSDTERRELFTLAYTSFAESPGSTPSSDLLDHLTDPVYAQPLLVTVDAFLNARPLPNAQRGRSPDELFDEVLHHEEKYWCSHWPASVPFDRDLARQAVSAATLVDIQNEDDAVSLLNLLPTNPGEHSKDLAQWLRRCYPPPATGDERSGTWCGHLEPDRIGEHLIASESANLDFLLRELLSPRRVGESSLRTWTVLERASTDPHLNEHVGQILNEVLAEVTQVVQAQAINTQSPNLATGLTRLLSATDSHIDPDKAYEAAHALNDEIYFALPMKLTLAERAANTPVPTRDATEKERADYARRQGELGVLQGKNGQFKEALTSSRKATEIHRELADSKPSTYTSDLATSLINLSLNLLHSGQQEEAVKIGRESTEICRRRRRKNSNAHTPDLALSLSNLALFMRSSGEFNEALPISREAVEIYRHQPDENSESHKSGLASALQGLAASLSAVDRRTEALSASQEATDIYRDLASKHPATHLPDLASALGGLASDLGTNGRHDEALGAIQEAVTIRRQLALRTPTNAHRSELADSLNNLSVHLSENGQHEDALEAIQEAVTICRELAAHDPAAHTGDLAMTLHNLSSTLGDNGQRDEALKAIQEAVSIRRQLAQRTPTNACRSDLAVSLSNLSVHLSENGQREDALKVIQEAVAIRQELAQRNPAAHNPDLAFSLHYLTEHLADTKRWDDALGPAQDAAALFRDLSQHQPRVYSSNFEISLETYARVLEGYGSTEEATRVRQEREDVLKQIGEMEANDD